MSGHAAGMRIVAMRRSARAERLRARAPRYLFTALVAITSLVGLREIVVPERPPPPPQAPDINVDQAAEDLAQRFARAYLSYDPTRPESRERELAALLPRELAFDGGFDAGRGARVVSWTQVAQNQRAAAGGRTVVVAAGFAGLSEVAYFAVPIERLDDGRLRLAGYPSFVGPPIVETEAALRQRQEVEDPDVVAAARRTVENYLAGDARLLKADLAPAAVVSLPPQRFRLIGLTDVVWTAGPRNSEGVLVTVDARDQRGGTYSLTYELGIDRRAGRPVVTYVETAPTQT